MSYSSRVISHHQCYWGSSSAALLVIEIEGVVEGCPLPDTHLKSNRYSNYMGGKAMSSVEHEWVCHYFHIFSATSVVLGTHSNFHTESIIVLIRDSEDRRHLFRSMTPLSLISVTSISAPQLTRSKHKVTQLDFCPHYPYDDLFPIRQELCPIKENPDCIYIPQLIHSMKLQITKKVNYNVIIITIIVIWHFGLKGAFIRYVNYNHAFK